MGYAKTLIIIWGVSLTPEQAKKIYEKYFSEGEFEYDVKDTLTEEIAYEHRGTPIYRERNMPQMVADGADSRIDDLSYSKESDDHVLGIYVASKGYAYTDNIEEHIKNIGGKTFENFDKYIKPILQEEGISEEPKMRIMNQVW